MKFEDKKLGISVRAFDRSPFTSLVFSRQGFETRIQLNKKLFRKFCCELKKTLNLKALRKLSKENTPEKILLRKILAESEKDSLYFYQMFWHNGKPKLSTGSESVKNLNPKEQKLILKTGIGKDFTLLMGWFSGSINSPILSVTLSRNQFLKFREYCFKIAKKL